jgi:hypothetical protein
MEIHSSRETKEGGGGPEGEKQGVTLDARSSALQDGQALYLSG